MLCHMKRRFIPRSLRAACVVMALAGVSPGAVARQPAGGTDVSLPPVLDRAAAYVKEYQETLTFIVADEVYTQEIRSQVPAQPRMPRMRTLTSTASSCS